MRHIGDLQELAAWREHERRDGRRVALVPTMGALHEGHLRLVDAARAAANTVIMSVFVNPLQFRPGEDFERYPRDLVRDEALAQSRGVDAVFAPSVAAMYGDQTEIRIVPGETASRWEGAIRPGHFDGVLTVVAKLFHLIAPDVAVFGQKDIQQVTLIRRMVEELNFPVVLDVVPIVREPDGLALSSRNVYLSHDQRREATALSRALGVVAEQWRQGARDAALLEAAARRVLDAAEGVVTEYIAITEPVRLAPVTVVEPGSIVAVAARVGTTRLIDNMILSGGA